MQTNVDNVYRYIHMYTVSTISLLALIIEELMCVHMYMEYHRYFVLQNFRRIQCNYFSLWPSECVYNCLLYVQYIRTVYLYACIYRPPVCNNAPLFSCSVEVHDSINNPMTQPVMFLNAFSSILLLNNFLSTYFLPSLHSKICVLVGLSTVHTSMIDSLHIRVILHFYKCWQHFAPICCANPVRTSATTCPSENLSS